MASESCLMPNSGLSRHYHFCKIVGDQLYLGTTGGEVCIFNVDNRVYRATMPIAKSGLICMSVLGNTLFVGSGDNTIKRLQIADDGMWNLTHEAALDSKIMSVVVSPEGKELLVGTSEGRIYRVLTDDLSFLLHTNSHSGAIKNLNVDATSSDHFVSIDDEGVLKLWDLSTYKPVIACSSGRQGLHGSSCCIAKDDKQILTGWSDGFVRCFDGQDSSLHWELANAHRGSVNCIYADQLYIITGGADGSVRVWSR
jgi:cilia- and flagella-associated protein 52